MKASSIGTLEFGSNTAQTSRLVEGDDGANVRSQIGILKSGLRARYIKCQKTQCIESRGSRLLLSLARRKGWQSRGSGYIVTDEQNEPTRLQMRERHDR